MSALPPSPESLSLFRSGQFISRGGSDDDARATAILGQLDSVKEEAAVAHLLDDIDRRVATVQARCCFVKVLCLERQLELAQSSTAADRKQVYDNRFRSATAQSRQMAITVGERLAQAKAVASGEQLRDLVDQLLRFTNETAFAKFGQLSQLSVPHLIKAAKFLRTKSSDQLKEHFKGCKLSALTTLSEACARLACSAFSCTISWSRSNTLGPLTEMMIRNFLSQQ